MQHAYLNCIELVNPYTSVKVWLYKARRNYGTDLPSKPVHKEVGTDQLKNISSSYLRSYMI